MEWQISDNETRHAGIGMQYHLVKMKTAKDCNLHHRATSIDHTPVNNSDCDTVMVRQSSISCLPTWPQTHPLGLGRLLTWSLKSGEHNYPVWLKE